MLQGSLGQVFGVCANEWSEDDGRVVSLDHGCGAHSETDVEPHPTDWPDDAPVIDEMSVEIVDRGAQTPAADAETEPGAAAVSQTAAVSETAAPSGGAPTQDASAEDASAEDVSSDDALSDEVQSGQVQSGQAQSDEAQTEDAPTDDDQADDDQADDAQTDDGLPAGTTTDTQGSVADA